MGYYEIIVESHVDGRRMKDFEGMEYKHLSGGKTLFFGILRDQSELFSMLNMIRDMNLSLISVRKDHKEMGDML